MPVNPTENILNEIRPKHNPKLQLQFPEVAAAVRAAEEAYSKAYHYLWKIGDALIAECGLLGRMVSTPVPTRKLSRSPRN